MKINKIKLGLVATALSFALVAGTALAADLTFANDTTVAVNSHNYTILATSAATSFVIGATTLTVTVPASSQVLVVSPDSFMLNNNASLTQNCNGSSNSITITGPLTVVVTPDATTTCSAPQGSGALVSGGGGGGGGGGSVTVTPTTTTTTTTSSGSGSTSGAATLTVTPSSVMTSGNSYAGCTSNVGFSATTGMSCAGNTTVMTTPTHKTYNFGTATLKNGSKGAAVMQLQMFLNDTLNLGLVVDGKLGPKTIAVIKTWQKSHGLVADGLIGAKTKAMMNASVN